MSKTIKFLGTYAYAALSCGYLFTIGLFSCKNRALLYKIAEHFGRDWRLVVYSGENGQLFRAKVDRHSGGTWTRVPDECGHLSERSDAGVRMMSFRHLEYNTFPELAEHGSEVPRESAHGCGASLL